MSQSLCANLILIYRNIFPCPAHDYPYTTITLSSECPLLIPLNTSENIWFSDVFRRDQKGTMEEKGSYQYLA